MKRKILTLMSVLLIVFCFPVLVNAEETYKYEGISKSLDTVQRKNTKIELTADIEGNTSGLQYKFVWMKNSWKEWGVLKDFDNVPTVTWAPDKAGNYKIYVDIKDEEGNVVTYTRNFDIKNEIWNYQGIEIDKESPQTKANLPIKISAITEGEEGNLLYKFVWMKNNWKEWGVLQEFGPSNECLWTPDKAGDYSLYVDVKDQSGNVKTKNILYTILKNQWCYDGVLTVPEEMQECGQDVTITANVSGNTENLKYKFVWMKDNWKDWGVVQDFSENATATWKMPGKVGEYKIYVDIQDEFGDIQTQIINYFGSNTLWKIDQVSFGETSNICLGNSITTQVSVSGPTEGLQYKFVWMRDNWEDWGVLKPFGLNESVEWTPEKTGNYAVYIDVMDASGTVYEPYIEYFQVYEYKGVELSSSNIELGKSITITPVFDGNYKEGAEFKYVWAKPGWKEWGVIADFSSTTKVSWTPPAVGQYSIYVDMRVPNKNIVTKIGNMNVGLPIETKIKEIKEKYINVPYKWGGSTPSGWDCSGFTQWSLGYLGCSIPRNAASQALGGQAIDPFDMSKWKPGDVICYVNTSGRVSHAALYIGNGQLMHALNTRVGTTIHDVDYYERIDTETQRVTVRRYL